MKSSQVAALGALLSISSIGIIYFFINNDSTPPFDPTLTQNQVTSQTKQPHSQADIAIIETHSPAKNKNIIDASQFPPPGFHDKSEDVRTRYSAWQTSGNNFRDVPPHYAHLPSKHVDRAFLTINREGISALQTGGNLELSIPQTGSLFDAKVSTVDYHANGDKTLKAKIPGENGNYYTVTITQGKKATFGTISTPEGVYVLESGSSDGWIASKDDLVRQQNRDVSDAVNFDQNDDDIPSS